MNKTIFRRRAGHLRRVLKSISFVDRSGTYGSGQFATRFFTEHDCFLVYNKRTNNFIAAISKRKNTIVIRYRPTSWWRYIVKEFDSDGLPKIYAPSDLARYNAKRGILRQVSRTVEPHVPITATEAAISSGMLSTGTRTVAQDDIFTPPSAIWVPSPNQRRRLRDGRGRFVSGTINVRSVSDEALEHLLRVQNEMRRANGVRADGFRPRGR